MTIAQGTTARIEDWIVSVLAALEYNSEAVFKTADIWRHQLAAGSESFGSLAPFAFVSYWPADAAREGDFDLRQVLRFSILIGLDSKEAGIARCGDDYHLGASKIRDLIINALDKEHPGAGFNCDDLYYISETELLDRPKQYAFELHFQCNQL